MKVFIVHEDVAYEFGQVLGVFSTKKSAAKYIKDTLDDEAAHNKSFNRVARADDLSIQEWDMED